MALQPKSRRLIAGITVGLLGLAAAAWAFRDEFGMKTLRGPVGVISREAPSNRGMLGARFDESSASAKISEVLVGSAAAEAGLMPGDVLLAIDSDNVTDVAEVATIIATKSPGDEIAIRLQRGSEAKDVRVKLKGSN